MSTLAAQLVRNQQQLALRSTAQKRESTGFNLDALGTAEQIDELARGYNQVQFRNGAQSVLFQREDSSSRSDVNAAGVLQVVPDVGGRNQAYVDAYTHEQLQAAKVAKSQPFLQQYKVPLIIGAAGLGVLVFFHMLRH